MRPEELDDILFWKMGEDEGYANIEWFSENYEISEERGSWVSSSPRFRWEGLYR